MNPRKFRALAVHATCSVEVHVNYLRCTAATCYLHVGFMLGARILTYSPIRCRQAAASRIVRVAVNLVRTDSRRALGVRVKRACRLLYRESFWAPDSSKIP